jgi:uroporphyrinogen-III synthase
VSGLPLLVIRPEPGNSTTVLAARALGLTVLPLPLFRVEPREWDAPPSGEFDAVLIGSANALRHGGSGLADYAGLPAYVVGQATAAMARGSGFTVAAAGNGGLQDLLAGLEADGRRRVLRLAGAEHIDLNAPADTLIHTVIVYEAQPLAIPPGWLDRVGRGAVVVLHSAAAARHFSAECARLGIDRSRLGLACIGPRVAEAAGRKGWASVASAERPDDTALLALAKRMCQNARLGDTDDKD